MKGHIVGGSDERLRLGGWRVAYGETGGAPIGVNAALLILMVAAVASMLLDEVVVGWPYLNILAVKE